jgi:hypothetical protein
MNNNIIRRFCVDLEINFDLNIIINSRTIILLILKRIKKYAQQWLPYCTS